MTEPDNARFSELFEVIETYSRKGYYHQDKALQIIAGTYVFMFEAEEMPDARPVVDAILEQYDYVFTTLERGNLDPLSVDAVVRVALYKDDYTEWASTASATCSRARTAAPATTSSTSTTWKTRASSSAAWRAWSSAPPSKSSSRQRTDPRPPARPVYTTPAALVTPALTLRVPIVAAAGLVSC